MSSPAKCRSEHAFNQSMQRLHGASKAAFRSGAEYPGRISFSGVKPGSRSGLAARVPFTRDDAGWNGEYEHPTGSVDHDSPVQFIAVMVGLGIGAALFVELRRRALATHIDGSLKLALAAGVALVLGVVVGFGVAGPPFDFVLGVISLGTIGGAVQWRTVRDQLPRTGGLLLANIGGWLLAGIAVTATAFLAGDAIDGAFGSGLTGFVAILTVLGLIGGAVGGVIEGAALRRRLDGGS